MAASFRFCLNCNNMLYPREDRVNQQLLYTCRNCMYTEQASNPLIYKHQLISEISETAGVTQDLAQDPTLPRSNDECPKCHEHECVFFQSQERRAETTMILFYVCTHCGHMFRKAS